MIRWQQIYFYERYTKIASNHLPIIMYIMTLIKNYSYNIIVSCSSSSPSLQMHFLHFYTFYKVVNLLNLSLNLNLVFLRVEHTLQLNILVL